MGFPRQEYWSKLPFPSSGDLPDPGIEPVSPALQADSLLLKQQGKNPLAVQETWVQSLGQEDPLKKEMATHSIILAWEIPWTEKPGALWSTGSQKSQI